MLSSLMRLVEPLVFPLGLIWLVLLGSCIKCLIQKKKKQAIMPAAIVLLMTIVGGTPLPAYLLAGLERPFIRGPLESLEVADAVIMLGGVLQPSRYDSFESNFSSTVDRITTAAELIRLKKAPLLIVGGAELRFEGRVVAEGRLVAGFCKNGE